MEPLHIALGLGIGIVTGFINTLAGSGSLITLPFLIFLGLPASIANGTNRVGILFQTALASFLLHRKTKMPMRGTGVLIVPAVAGAITGAMFAIGITDREMQNVIGIIMVLMLIPLLFNSKKWLATHRTDSKKRNPWALAFVFLVIGFYGGFIQAGTGVFLISALVLIANYTVTDANLLKNLIVACYGLPALIVFIINDQVHWPFGLLLMSGQVTGAWIAAKFAADSKYAPAIIRGLLILMLIAGAIKMLLG